MARINSLPNFLSDVADAIRAKTGGSAEIQAEDFDTEIASITGGGMLQFSTIEQMNADTREPEGTSCVVFNNGTLPINSGDSVMSLVIPKTIVLDAAYTGNGFNINADNFIQYISVSPTQMDWELTDMGDGWFQAQVFYRSSDGITYTRQDNYDDGPFGDWMLEEAGMTWENDCLGFPSPKTISYTMPSDPVEAHITEQILFTKASDFYGVFEYKTDTDFGQIYGVKNLQEDGNGGYTYDKQLFSMPNFQTAVLSIYNAAGVSGMQSSMFYDAANNELILAPSVEDVYYTPTWSNFIGGTSASNTGTFTTTLYRANPITGEYIGSTILTGEVVGSWHYSGQTNTYYWIKYMDRPNDWYYLQFISWYPSENPMLTKSNIWNYYAYLINSYDYDTFNSTEPYSNEDVGFPELTKWFYATTSLTLSAPNQILPGVKAYGKNGIITGNNSVYNNLDMSNMLTPIFGITPIMAKSSPSGQASNSRLQSLTKYVGCSGDDTKLHYYKFANDFSQPISNFLIEINTDLTNKYPNTNNSVSNWKYVQDKNLIVYVTSNGQVVFENATTHQVLSTSTITSCASSDASKRAFMCVVQNSVFYIQQSFAYHGSRYSTIGLVVDKFDLDTYTKSNIRNLSFTDIASQTNSAPSYPCCSVIDNKYILYGIEYRPSGTTSTAHSYAYLYDTVANREITIRNNETLSSTSDVSICNIIGVKTSLDNIYVISSIGKGKNVKIHKYNPSNYTVSLVASGQTDQTLYNTYVYPFNNAYEDTNYFVRQSYVFSKSTCEYKTPKVVMRDTNNSIVYSNADQSGIFVQNNKTYMYLGGVDELSSINIDFANNSITCIATKFYATARTSSGLFDYNYTFPNNDYYITVFCRDGLVLTGITDLKVVENINCLQIKNIYGLDTIVRGCISGNSLDYDYSTLYCNGDFFVQFSSNMYNNALTLSNDIL